MVSVESSADWTLAIQAEVLEVRKWNLGWASPWRESPGVFLTTVSIFRCWDVGFWISEVGVRASGLVYLYELSWNVVVSLVDRTGASGSLEWLFALWIRLALPV